MDISTKYNIGDRVWWRNDEGIAGNNVIAEINICKEGVKYSLHLHTYQYISRFESDISHTLDGLKGSNSYDGLCKCGSRAYSDKKSFDCGRYEMYYIQCPVCRRRAESTDWNECQKTWFQYHANKTIK